MFNLSNVEVQNDDYALIPNGYYPAYIEKAEWKASASGVEYVNVQWKIFGEDYNNRVVFQMLHIQNANEVAKRIAMESLVKMLEASGVDKKDMNYDSKEALIGGILGSRCEIFVSTQKGTGGYQDKNEVKNYQKLTTKVDASQTPSEPLPF